jgi:hypothetical protein
LKEGNLARRGDWKAPLIVVPPDNNTTVLKETD